MRFYIPPNLQRDFTDSLNCNLGIDAIVNFNNLNTIRIRLDKVNYRTKNGQVTSNEVTFAEISSNLKMGDYLQYKNEVFIINQLISNEFPKCFEISSGTCNTKFTITRYQNMIQDDDGNIISPEGDIPIISELYCLTVPANSQFQATSGGVGIVPINQVNVQTQFNNDTKDFAIGDKFIWFKNTYQIINIDYSQVDISELYGVLSFTGEKVISNGS